MYTGEYYQASEQLWLDLTLIDAEEARPCLWWGEWWLVLGAMQWCYPCTDCNSNWEEGEAILAFKARFIKFSAHRNPINSKYGPCLLLQNTKQSLQLWIEISLKGRISRSLGGELSIEHWISPRKCPRTKHLPDSECLPLVILAPYWVITAAFWSWHSWQWDYVITPSASDWLFITVLWLA